MMIELFHELFTAMALVNLSLLVFSSLVIFCAKRHVYRLHASMFGLSEEAVAIVCYSYLGAYKVLIIVFNIVPLIALKMIL
jgi:hypothetical protein